MEMASADIVPGVRTEWIASGKTTSDTFPGCNPDQAAIQADARDLGTKLEAVLKGTGRASEMLNPTIKINL